MKCEICERDLGSLFAIDEHKCGLYDFHQVKRRAICNSCLIDSIIHMSPKMFKCPDCKKMYRKDLDECPHCKMGNPTKSPFLVEER